MCAHDAGFNTCASCRRTANEATDEVGILVSPELPLTNYALGHTWTRAGVELFQTSLKAAVTRFRNHPSIFDCECSNGRPGL